MRFRWLQSCRRHGRRPIIPSPMFCRFHPAPLPTGEIICTARHSLLPGMRRADNVGTALATVRRPPARTISERALFKRPNLSDDSYIAAAGPGNDAFRSRLQAEAKQKFPHPTPKLIDPDNQDHVLQLYAYLAKSLPLHVAFDVFKTRRNFRRRIVASLSPVSAPNTCQMIHTANSSGRR